MSRRSERERQFQQSRKWAAEQRAAQSASGGDSQFRTTQLGTSEDHPLNVRIVEAREQFFNGLNKSFDSDKNNQGDVKLRSGEAIETASRQIAEQLRLTAEMFSEGRGKLQRELDSALDGFQDSLEDFISRQKGKGPGRAPGGSGGNSGGFDARPAPHTPDRRPPPPPRAGAPTLADRIKGYDPADRLDPKKGIFGGSNDYWEAIARGERPEGGIQPSRNHAINQRELRQELGTRFGRALHNTIGLGSPSMPRMEAIRDSDGVLVGHKFHDGTGGEGEIIGAGDTARIAEAENIISKASNSTVRMTATRVGGAMASKAGFGAIAKAIPAVGWSYAAAEAGDSLAREATEQRAKNAYYQNIYGGSNFSAFGDRIGEEATVIGERFSFGMDDEMTRRVYRDVSKLGYDGERRDRAVDFIGQNYKRFGMDDRESMKLVEASANSANESLVGVSKSLGVVSSRARQMGMNVGKMTESFVHNYTQIAKMGGGSGAGPLAAAITAMGPGMGRGMEDVDFSGLYSNNAVRLLGGLNGRTYNQQMRRMENDPTGYARDADSWINSQTQGLDTGGFQAAVLAEVERRGGPEALKKNPNLMREIIKDVQDQGYEAPDAQQLMEMYNSIGGNITDPEDALVVFGNRAVDPNYAENEAKKAAAEAKVRPLTEEEKNQTYDDLGAGGFKELNPFKTTKGRRGEDREWYDVTGQLGDLGSRIFGQSETGYEAVKDLEYQTGNKNPVFDQLLEQGLDSEEVGVEVDTPEGKKVIPMAQAMREYGDQISRGDARIIGGEHDGQKISDINGVTVDKTAQGDSASRNAEGGVSADEWKKEYGSGGDSASGTGGSTIVDLSEDAKKLLKILPPAGGVDSERGASAGAPPAPSGTPTIGGDG